MAEVLLPAVHGATVVRYTGRVSTHRDEGSPDVTGWIADRLSSARADAERIARELLRDGRLGADEVGALAAAVDEAVERGRALIGDALREPRRILAGLREATASAVVRGEEDAAVPPRQDAAARIARLEARVAALEALVAGDVRSRGEGEGI
jgi:hypothetical protein